MKSIRINGVVSPEELQNLVASFSSEIESFRTYTLNGTVVTIIGAGKYYLRTNDRIGFYLLSASSGMDQRIDFSSVGGGGGFLNISLGSKKRYEEEATYALEDLLKKKDIGFESTE